MAAQYYKINYKSDFVLTINSDAGWAVPFCIKFWTGMPSHGYFAGFDGENYVNCRVGETPTQLLVMFDDHHMPIGQLRMQIAYHTTIEEFPDRKFDEVTNPTNVTVDIDGTEYQVMLDFTGETGAEIDFSMPSSGVMSVNGKIGYVTLNAEDVGAQPTIEDLATIRSGAAAGATAYQKPAGGIPKTDLASAVQTSLNKADAAAPQSNTYTKSEVDALIEGQTMIVTISPDGNDGYEADKTFAEIKEFIDNGGTVIAKDEEDGDSYYYLDNYIASEVVFTRNIWGSGGFSTRCYTIDNTNTVSFIDSVHHISSAVNSSSTADLANSAAVKALRDSMSEIKSISVNNVEQQYDQEGNVDIAVPTSLADLAGDSTHRTVTDAEKSTWNGKQNALTFDNVPTANSNNPVKSGGIKTALDAKQSTINTVNVTVDNNTGTPSGSASVSGSTLSLSFQNLKGATGATGATGPQGPQGERGLPGESGVTGDVSGFTVIQTIDPSATYGATDIAGAATVQATNAEFTELAGKVNGEDYTPTYTASRGNYINASGEKAENSSFSITTPFAVSAGSTVTFEGKANGNMACIAQTDANESSYTVLKVGESNSTTKTYTATVNEDCYIVISYYGLTSISVTTPALSVRIEQNKSNITSLATTVDSVKWLAGGVLTIEPEWNSGAIDLNGNIVAVTGYYYTSPILIGYDGLLTFNAKTSGNYTAIALTNSSGNSHTVMVKGLTAASYNDYILNVEAGQYISLCGYYPYDTNISTQTLTITPINGRVREVEKTVSELNLKTIPLNDVISCYDFNGVNAYISFNAITLSSDGDSIEFDVEPNATPNQYYNFLGNSVNSSHLGVFLSKTGFFVRADDNSYLFTNEAINPSNARFKFKISYENGNVAVYIDGVKVAETDGVQKAFTTNKLGYSGSSVYTECWKGRVYSVNINDNGAIMLNELDGYVSTNAELIYPYGMLTEEQYNMLMSSSSASKCVVIATDSAVNVYFQINGSNYGHAVIEHQTSSEIAKYGYKDLWRLTTCVMSRYENNTFTNTSTSLLVGAENEFAINMQGMGDFTGGYHGFERIDLDNACYVTFIVDGQEYTITELIALGTVNCDTFGYRQKSLYYTGGNLSYQEPFAWHVKTTTFDNKGYNTRNFVLFDFTNAPNVNSMSIITLLKGLVCVHKDCALYVVGNDGTRHEATHPSTTVGDWVTFQSHPTDSRIKMYNGGLSCYLNSVVVGKTTLTGVNENTGFVSIYDRQNDCKYYSYAYTGGTIAVNDGDYIEVECNVEFFKKRDN